MTDVQKRAAFPHPAPLRLTERRKQIVKFCHQYAECHGWAASIEEIAQHCKTPETSVSHEGVTNDLRALDVLGYIIYQGSRQIRVLMLP